MVSGPMVQVSGVSLFMQEIFTLKPYKFVPPVESRIVSRLNRIIKFHRWLIWRREGVRGHEVRGQEHLQQSIAAGHSILLSPNHSRTADPIALGFICEALGIDMYAMASWHLFNQSWIMRHFIRGIGAFSVNREGMDRASIDKAIELLVKAERPLVVFAEGSTSRTCDRLLPFMEGLGFIARAAAKQREKLDQGAVVIHPVAMRYEYQGDIRKTGPPILDRIEERMTWQPNREPEMLPRLRRIGLALLALKEIEVFGAQQNGSVPERRQAMIDRLLTPLEIKWLGKSQDGTFTARIKSLRTKMLPDLTNGQLNEAEKQQRFAELRDTYVAHQMACYPLDYLEEYPSVERVRETIERFEEDTTDQATLHRPMKCIIEIGPAVSVTTQRQRRSEGGDPVMQEVFDSLQSILTRLGRQSRLYSPAAPHLANQVSPPSRLNSASGV